VFLDADRADEWLPCPEENCGHLMAKQLAAPAGRVRGRADGKDRNDADRFTADVMGVKERDLPPGLRSKR
jgi:hypothetical protein